MTDAFASRNVSKTNDTAAVNKTKEETTNNNMNEENCLPGSLITNLNCNCNETSSSTKETPMPTTKLSDSTKYLNVTAAMDSFQNNQSTVSGVADINTVLKYVYKKNKILNIPDKITGHPKNSLLRKKRSLSSGNLNDTKAPLIVNYETKHGPQRDVEIWLPARNTANVIKHSDLADFNIETLHENNNEHINKDINDPPRNIIRETTNDSDENIDRENHKNSNEKSNSHSEESSERNNESSENYQNSSENEQYPRNNEQYSDPRENNKSENLSSEEETNLSIEKDEAGTKRSQENNDSKEFGKSKYINGVDESNENSSEEREKELPRYRTENKEKNTEEGFDSNYKAQEKYKHVPRDESSYTPSINIQDIDLGEYENIHVNQNGKTEKVQDENKNPAIEIFSTLKPNLDLKSNAKIKSVPSEITDSFNVESNEHSEPTHIDDGEVKPVVEINSETDSTESSDENSNEALKAKLESESLETLTGVNENDSSEKKNTIQQHTESQNQGDLKQQFERIPLNYNHAGIKQNKELNNKHVEIKEDENQNTNDEGTLDKLAPRYDDKLNIKFDDISIKLPEIKLPDDILSYAFEYPPVYKNKDGQNEPNPYEDSPIYIKDKEEQVEPPILYKDPPPTYYKDKKDYQEKEKPRFYHYSDEIQEKPHAQIKEEDDNDEDDDSNINKNEYYGYYGDKKNKEEYKQKENTDHEHDNDDLYEKFVRERFGKRGTFEKRLEKLTDYKAQNPHLYKKVKHILKKTKDVKNEADKSGDPNAGYMWTLEYGEKL